jgi:hypothetical protein
MIRQFIRIAVVGLIASLLCAVPLRAKAQVTVSLLANLADGEGSEESHGEEELKDFSHPSRRGRCGLAKDRVLCHGGIPVRKGPVQPQHPPRPVALSWQVVNSQGAGIRARC